MLNFQQIDESGKTKNIKAEVVGVMEEGTNVIGHDFGQGQILQNDYRDIYSTYYYSIVYKHIRYAYQVHTL